VTDLALDQHSAFLATTSSVGLSSWDEVLKLQVDLFAASELRFLAGLAPWLNGHRVLDVGCGNGVFTTRLGRRFPEKQYVGIDVSPELIARALSTPLAGVAFSVADFFTFKPEQKFDVILMRFIAQHLTDFEAILTQAEKLLVSQGALLIIEPSLDKSLNVPATPRFKTVIADFERARGDSGRIRQRLQNPLVLLADRQDWRITDDEIVYVRYTGRNETQRIHRLYRKWTEMFERSGLLVDAFADVYRELDEWATADNARSEIALRAICFSQR
jgi:ubiquinone/menaquinone biosynthesis C-methylase UbiE